MSIAFTVTQKQRLIELDADDVDKYLFNNTEERDMTFKKLHKELVRKNKTRLHRLAQERKRPLSRAIESKLVNILNEAGFVEVTTPTMLSKGMLGKMGIKDGHPLLKQIYWLDKNTCLRPMLAPNLYYLMGHLNNVWSKPIRFFEIGQCFRKESKGAKHLSEFTMLNLVEMGVDVEPNERLAELAGIVMNGIKIEYTLEFETSEVYGDTIDVVADGIEIASGAMGPHPLDSNWNISENWIGLGFGLERMAMVKEDYQNIRRVGRSLIYLDGARLNI